MMGEQCVKCGKADDLTRVISRKIYSLKGDKPKYETDLVCQEDRPAIEYKEK
jgi:hypothetical protein